MARRVRATGLVKTALLHRKTVGIDTDRGFLAVGFLDTAKSNVDYTSTSSSPPAADERVHPSCDDVVEFAASHG